MGVNDAREQLEVCKDEYGKLERENAELRAVIERVRVARSNHPECDIHPDDDIVKCGWKRAVLDIDKALSQCERELFHPVAETTESEES